MAPADSTARSRAQWAREASAIRGDVVQAPAAQPTQFIGVYGPHRITVANARLHYQDETGISYRLFSLPNGLFAVNGMPIVRIRFGVSASGKASSLVRLYWDGDRFEDARTR